MKISCLPPTPTPTQWEYALSLLFNDTTWHVESQGSSVSNVSGYGLDDRAIEVRSPAEARGFFL
jgi:hypothetical protein